MVAALATLALAFAPAVQPTEVCTLIVTKDSAVVECHKLKTYIPSWDPHGKRVRFYQ